MLGQRESTLDAFDKVRVREIRDCGNNTVAAFLTKFQTTAANLEPDERIKLVVYTDEDIELVRTVLADPQADKICSLFWSYSEEDDVHSVMPLLIDNCLELTSLEIKGSFAFDVVSSILEHPSNRIKVIEMPKYTKGDLARFFAALEQSQVAALTVTMNDSLEFARGFYEYLAKDLLARLDVWMDHKPVPAEMIALLATCNQLTKLGMWLWEFSEPTAFAFLPKSITKLVLCDCKFGGGANWSFLVGSGVRELDFRFMKEDYSGSALAVHLRTKGLDKLRIYNCNYANYVLAQGGAGIGRIKRLDLEDSSLDNASVKLIALALQSRSNEMKELRLEYNRSTMSGIESRLVPALKHTNCILDKLSLWASQKHGEAAKAVVDTFRSYQPLFMLLQGQQVRRLRSPLRRLLVELLRMVGEVLL